MVRTHSLLPPSPSPLPPGKTTTLKMLSGDVLPSSGTATLAGYDVLTQQPEVRRLLGYCEWGE